MMEKQKKDRRKIWFVTLAIFMAGVTGLNVYLYTGNQNSRDFKQVKAQSEIYRMENTELKKKVKEALPSQQEQERKSYLSVAEQRIERRML